MVKDLLKKKSTQLVLALLLGVTVGALFYPTKSIKEKYELQIKELKKESSTKIAELEESLESSEEENREYQEETRRTMSELRTENRELRKSMKRKKFKLVKPDGTIIEKEYEESQSEEISSVVTEIREEFDQKVSSIESRWKKVHLERVSKLREQHESEIKKIRSEKKERVVEVNKKKLRPEIGINTNLDAYFHMTYSLWGPVFIGGGASVNPQDGQFGEARFGLGLEL